MQFDRIACFQVLASSIYNSFWTRRLDYRIVVVYFSSHFGRVIIIWIKLLDSLLSESLWTCNPNKLNIVLVPDIFLPSYSDLWRQTLKLVTEGVNCSCTLFSFDLISSKSFCGCAESGEICEIGHTKRAIMRGRFALFLYRERDVG